MLLFHSDLNIVKFKPQTQKLCGGLAGKICQLEYSLYFRKASFEHSAVYDWCYLVLSVCLNIAPCLLRAVFAQAKSSLAEQTHERHTAEQALGR